MKRFLIAPCLDFIWPTRCLNCETADSDGIFCTPCLETLVSGAEVCCPSCGLVWLDPPPGGGTHRCGDCLTSPPPWRRVRGAYAYGGPLRSAIQRWKNAPDDTMTRELTRLMIGQASACGWDALAADGLVVPIPASKHRLWRRGFSPAGVLARGLATQLERPLMTRGLRTTRRLENTRRMTRKERTQRVAGVFQGDPRRLAGRDILLVDDVMTTGATMRAAALAARRAGATTIEGAVLARVPYGAASAGV